MEMKKYRLGEICYLNKSSLKSNDAISVILYLDTSSITENIISGLQTFSIKDAPSRAQRKVKKNTIIFSTVRPNQKHYGIIHNPQNNLIISSGFTTLDVKNQNEFDPEFVYLTLTQPVIVNYLHTLAQNSVSSYPSINPDDIGNLYLSFPCFDTQRKIAAILSALDNKIALNRRINAKLEQMAKRLYDYWFVQFDFPNAEGKPYKSSGGKMVYNATLKREIPEGWEVDNLYKITDFVNGLACQKFRPKKGENALPVIKITEMHNGLSDNTESVSENIPVKYIINDGDVLFSWSASLEVMVWNNGRGGLNQHIFKVLPKKGFSKEYVYQQLSAYVINFVKMAEARKTTMGHITSDHLNQSRIAIPPSQLVDNYTNMCESIYKEQTIIAKENARLTALRDKLLPLLMNGQVTVK